MNNCVICGNAGRGCFVCDPKPMKFKAARLGPPAGWFDFKAEPMVDWAQFEAKPVVKPAKPVCPMGPDCPICHPERARFDPVFGDMWGVPPTRMPAPQPAPQTPGWHDVLAKMGYTPGVRLGAGCFAKVYAINEDPTRVVKITTDKHDAQAAELARRHQEIGECENLARIFKVMRLRERSAYGNEQYMVIVERLQPIPAQARDYLPYESQQMNSNAGANLLDVARLGEEGDIYVPDYNRGRTNAWSLAALNIKGICDDLNKIGVTHFPDFHLQNVMVRPGDRVVLSDFGCSTTPRVDIAEVA